MNRANLFFKCYLKTIRENPCHEDDDGLVLPDGEVPPTLHTVENVPLW